MLAEYSRCACLFASAWEQGRCRFIANKAAPLTILGDNEIRCFADKAMKYPGLPDPGDNTGSVVHKLSGNAE